MTDAFMNEQRKLAQENLDVVTSNGFDPPTWENFPIRVMLVITEIDEAVDAVKGTGEDSLEEELADIWIRISGILCALWGDQWDVRYATHPRRKFVFKSIEELLWPIGSRCCKAVEAWRKDERIDARMHLEFALREVALLVWAMHDDITTHVRLKLAKNKKRAQFHGKAKSNA